MVTVSCAGTIGVAVVTAGPGVTNTVTALQNARLAESPLVLMGGAAATILKVEFWKMITRLQLL